MITTVYLYDNNTGTVLPTHIESAITRIISGDTVADIHSKIEKGSKLFCTFSNISNVDIAVSSDKIRDILIRIFGDKYNIQTIDNSVWYTNRAQNNIIVSSKAAMSKDTIAEFIGQLIKELGSNQNRVKNKMYYVVNFRNSETIHMTPRYSEAVDICNKSPSCMVIDKDNNVLHRSAYGKVPIPYKSDIHTKQHKGKLTVVANLSSRLK